MGSQHHHHRSRGVGSSSVFPAFDYIVPRDDDNYTVSFEVKDLHNDGEVEKVREFFSRYGFVVVKDVLSQKECNDTLNEIYQILEHPISSPSSSSSSSGSDGGGGGGGVFDRHNVNTWHHWPPASLEQYGSPQRAPIFKPQFLRNRTHPNVYDVFRTILREDDLLVNHDRCCLFRPTTSFISSGHPHHPESSWITKPNLHLDMNPWAWLGDGEECRRTLDSLTYEKLNDFIHENNQPSHTDGIQLQGVLNLYDNMDEDGGFHCVAGFLHFFEEYFSKLPPNMETASYNWQTRDPLFSQATRVTMRAGSMVVWDQRMPHGSLPNKGGRIRSAQFIKMFPTRTVSSQRRSVRRAAIGRQLANLTMIHNHKADASTHFVLDPLARQLLDLKDE
eukprot:TRINITY_DN15884_c0_g2_i1.p1 TRINITY_DN15884_c0_g2~~TRINITY_DN15884_c0_g2_i1.p1  ORF type:complete len:390 (-),score=48.27 TRINITY_DN15884_c0_g2_i1:44-1213(-)